VQKLGDAYAELARRRPRCGSATKLGVGSRTIQMSPYALVSSGAAQEAKAILRALGVFRATQVFA